MGKKHIIQFIFSTLLCCLSMQQTQAQENFEIDFQTDIVSQNIYRGQVDGSASIQPALSTVWKGVKLELLGSIGFVDTKDPRQLDMVLSYNLGKFSFGLVNYWDDLPKEPYFYFGDNSGHQFEGYLTYDFGLLSASWSTIFAGSDARNNDNKRAYSSYFELTAPFTIKGIDGDVQVGVVPWATDYYETDGFAVTNITLNLSKDVRITDSFSLPLFASLIGNPCSRDLFFVAGMSFKIF